VPIDRVISGSITLTHGTSPNTAMITCAPFNPPYRLRGSLMFRCGGQQILMRDCRLVDVQYEIGGGGRQLMNLFVQDPRWKWQFGWIRGVWNLREGDDKIRQGREKKPRELAKMCFDEMGVTRRDVSRLPDDSRPYVDWDGPPAEALNQLVEGLGCRVVFNPLANRAEIVEVGIGNQLPNGVDVMADSIAANPPEVPDSLIFLGGPNEYQWDFELEAIGPEPDGEIKPIDDLSYTPAGGWHQETFPFCDGVAAKHRELASNSILRMWRIKTPVMIFDQNVADLNRILPIQERLLQTGKVDGRANERLPAIVFGTFIESSWRDPEKTVTAINGNKYQVYGRGFSADTDHGIITTAEPVYLWGDGAGGVAVRNQDPENRDVRPAKLWLRTTVNIRDADSYAWLKRERTRQPNGPRLTTKPKTLSRDDVRYQQWHHWDGTNLRRKNNDLDFITRAEHYLLQELRTWQILTPGTRVYAGLRGFPLDGAIQQITWQVDDSGRTTTTISRNQEVLSPALTYEQKRRLDALKNLLREERGR
jgi:hypothetical protein